MIVRIETAWRIDCPKCRFPVADSATTWNGRLVGELGNEERLKLKVGCPMCDWIDWFIFVVLVRTHVVRVGN